MGDGSPSIHSVSGYGIGIRNVRHVRIDSAKTECLAPFLEFHIPSTFPQPLLLILDTGYLVRSSRSVFVTVPGRQECVTPFRSATLRSVFSCGSEAYRTVWCMYGTGTPGLSLAMSFPLHVDCMRHYFKASEASSRVTRPKRQPALHHKL